MARLKPTEYGGSDTQDTLGIQPDPRVLTAEENLRVVYAHDVEDPNPLVIPNLTPRPPSPA